MHPLFFRRLMLAVRLDGDVIERTLLVLALAA
jgi:hypothetical protein